jgi:hypothetical protein
MRFSPPTIYGIIVLLFFLPGTSSAQAKFSFIEKALAGGSWQYEFTLSNTASAPGADLYDLSFTFPSSGAFSVISLPSGWDYFSTWDPVNKAGAFELISLTPGPPPGGSDIPPGFSLPGFSFRFDTQIDPVPFTATFVNPGDPGNPLTFSGTSEPAGYQLYLPLLMG